MQFSLIQKKDESTQRTIGQPNDRYEQEADRVADQVMHMPQTEQPIQRKCADCEEEEIQMKPINQNITAIQRMGLAEEEEEVQMKGFSSQVGNGVGLENKIQQSQGKGANLPNTTRQQMEQGIGANFSQVNIHTGHEAIQMNRSLNARAFTHGSDIYFNQGEYQPQSNKGQHLLAHELTHVVQQSQGNQLPNIQRQAMPGEVADQDILRHFDIGQGRGAAQAPPASAPPIIDRGTNPSVCFPPTCDLVTGFRASPPTTEEALFAIADNMSQSLIVCMQGHAAASPASHAADIQTAAEGELNRNIQDLKTWFSGVRNTLANRREFIDRLSHLCRLTAKEVNVEFHFNVIFENPVGQPAWAQREDGWDRIFDILSQLPEGTLWNLPNTFRMRREDCDRSKGFCDGRVGGVTEMNENRVRIFDSGMSRAPFGRSEDLALPGDYQTMIHEVGHVVDSGLDRAQRDHFFADIMDWKDYPWGWITIPPGNTPTCDAGRTGLARERCNLCTDLQLLDGSGACNDTDLDTWLATMTEGASVELNGRRWWRPRGVNKHHIHSLPLANIPAGRVFEYANTDRAEYLAELYALAILRPEFLDRSIDPRQSEWLRRVVFQIPDQRTLQTRVALQEPQQTEYMLRVVKLYTWEQIDALTRELINSASMPGNMVG